MNGIPSLLPGDAVPGQSVRMLYFVPAELSVSGVDKLRSLRRASALSNGWGVPVRGRRVCARSRDDTASRALHSAMKPAGNWFATSIKAIPAMRGSFISRSCKVWWVRSTRYVARGVNAWIASIPSRSATRPNSVLPSPLTVSLTLTLNIP